MWKKLRTCQAIVREVELEILNFKNLFINFFSKNEECSKVQRLNRSLKLNQDGLRYTGFLMQLSSSKHVIARNFDVFLHEFDARVKD